MTGTPGESRSLGVQGVGAYLPRLRVTADELERGWGRDKGGVTRSVPDADEDALTMAVAAARRALHAANTDPESVDAVVFATTTPPVEEGALTTRLGAALGVPESATRSVRTADAASGVRTLGAASGRAADDSVLVVAADCPRGASDDDREAVAGAGGAAFLLGTDGPLRVTDAAESGPAYPGTRFRRTGSEDVDGVGVSAYDRRALRETMAGAVTALDADLDGVDAAAVQAPTPDVPYRAASALGVDEETVTAGTVVDGVGDAGAASVPLSLAFTLSGVDPLDTATSREVVPERLLAAGYGGDGAALVALHRVGDVPTAVDARPPRTVAFGDCLRRRADVVSGAPEGGGAHVSVPAWQRSLPERYRLRAGRCPDCDAVSFPPGGACDDCGSLAVSESVELRPQGRVETISTVTQGGAPPEFREYQARIGARYATAVAAFPAPGGGEASLPLLVVDDGRGDAGASRSLGVGDPVEAVFRRIYTQEGVTRYGTKLRPATDADEGADDDPDSSGGREE